MSWITVIWSMVASACLTLSAMHLLVWFKKRTARANLLFALTAIATAAIAACELWMMHSHSPGMFGLALRMLHIPSWVLIVSLVGFVRLYMRVGRPWLAWSVCGVRTLSLILNFIFTPNLNYREISALHHIRFLGESVSAVDGTPNPWMLVGQISLFLLAIFIIDASITVWKRGDRRQALLVGVPCAFFTLAVMVQIVLVLWKIIPVPLTVSLFYMGVIAAMAYEMSNGMFRAEQLSDDLLKNERRLSDIIFNIGDLVWETDENCVYIYSSPQGFELLGRVIGKTPFDFMPPDEAKRVAALFSDIAARKMPIHDLENWNIGKGGERICLLTNALPIFDEKGNFKGYRGVDKDITERRENEIERAQLRMELAHLARVMTMNELSGSLAHEINQPLGAILNNASAAKLLLSQVKDKPEDLNEIMEDIIKDTKRAGDVVRKIRGMVKKGEMEYEPVQLNALIEEITALFRNAMSIDKVSLNLELLPEVATVRGDRVHLQQVLLNLISNALEAMKERPSKVLTIRLELREPDMVIVSVSDTGPGINETIKDNVFKPFFTTKKDGLGFGLAICRSIIEEHGGKIWIENNPDKGATAAFSLKAWRGVSA